MPSPSKVLILVTSTQRRGAELEGAELAAQLQAVGIDAVAVALAAGAHGAQIEVPVLGRARLGVSTLRELRRRAADVDVVIAYGSTTLTACAIAMTGLSTPFIYRSIGDPSAWAHNGWRRRRTGLLYRRARRVVVLWPAAADAVGDLYGVPSNRIDVIPNARNPDDFMVADDSERKAARERLGLPEVGLVVGCVGSISQEKRVDIAVDVVAEYSDASLLVVGDGPLRADVEKAARLRIGDRGVFTGVLELVADAYAAIDVLLLTSATEGMPGVIIEAAMSGVPAVAPDVGAVRWMIENGAAGEVVVASATARDFADAVGRTASRHIAKERSAMSVCAWSEVVDRWRSTLDASMHLRELAA